MSGLDTGAKWCPWSKPKCPGHSCGSIRQRCQSQAALPSLALRHRLVCHCSNPGPILLAACSWVATPPSLPSPIVALHTTPSP